MKNKNIVSANAQYNKYRRQMNRRKVSDTQNVAVNAQCDGNCHRDMQEAHGSEEYRLQMTTHVRQANNQHSGDLPQIGVGETQRLVLLVFERHCDDLNLWRGETLRELESLPGEFLVQLPCLFLVQVALANLRPIDDDGLPGLCTDPEVGEQEV